MNICKSTKIYPYVYKCVNRNTGEFYIGYRENHKVPSTDDLPVYKTSSKKVHPIFSEFDWQIIAEFFDSRDALDFEQALIYEHWTNPLLLNEMCHHGHKRFKGGVKKGTIPWNKGKKMSAEFRKMRSRIQTGSKQTAETRAKRIVSLLGKNKGKSHPNSAESNLRRSITMTGKPKEKVACPHCGKIGGISTMHRWHFENCKAVK